MKQLRRLIAAALLIAGITPALAQTFPTVPSQTVIGRTAFGTGPAQAIPFAQITAQICSTVTLTVKGCLPPPGSTTGRYFGDNLTWNAIPSQQVVAGTGVTLGGTCVGTALNCTVNSVATTQFVYTSRATAAALNLSSFSVIRTLGYATAGDGGGAVFVKVGAVPFKDSYITAGTIAGGSGYTNGTYLGVRMGGGTGLGCMAKVTIAGNAVTAVDLLGNYCAQYAIGDVLVPLQADVGGTGSGATFTVSTISTATGSFTDGAGNKWQITTDSEGFPNVRQFGAKLDWNGVDASATNDLLSFRSAFAFAVVPFSTAGAYVAGTTVIVPKGAAYLCAGSAPFTTLVIPQGVNLRGPASQYGATLKQCAGEDSSTHFLTLCDYNSQVGQFGCKLENFSIVSDGASNNGIAAIYSNSGQQFPLINNIFMNITARGCILYEVGKGGASNAIFDNFDCEMADTNTNKGFIGNSSGTQIVIRNSNFGCAPGLCAAGKYAINMISGLFIVDTIHIESHRDAINVATTSAAHLSSIRNATLDNGCVNGITLQATNPNNTVLVENIESSCSTATVLNGHAAGANVTGHILAQRVFNP
jgi:hypothetical protein